MSSNANKVFKMLDLRRLSCICNFCFWKQCKSAKYSKKEKISRGRKKDLIKNRSYHAINMCISLSLSFCWFSSTSHVLGFSQASPSSIPSFSPAYPSSLSSEIEWILALLLALSLSLFHSRLHPPLRGNQTWTLVTSTCARRNTARRKWRNN